MYALAESRNGEKSGKIAALADCFGALAATDFCEVGAAKKLPNTSAMATMINTRRTFFIFSPFRTFQICGCWKSCDIIGRVKPSQYSNRPNQCRAVSTCFHLSDDAA